MKFTYMTYGSLNYELQSDILTANLEVMKKNFRETTVQKVTSSHILPRKLS